MNEEMSYGEDYHRIPATSLRSGAGEEVAPDIWCETIQIVNVCFVGQPNSDDWVLIDAGMPGSAGVIIDAAEQRFGDDRKPRGIVLTHGHFDHVGAIIDLIDYWDVPVFAHELELPYLTGKESYPPADTSVEGGLVAKMSFLFPVSPIQLGHRVTPLPGDGTIPIMPEWRWIHTPGHAAGHISLFRDRDRALIAGDAFVAVKQDSLYQVFTQEYEMNGPPRYLTTDWALARESVKKLESLKPVVAVTGHGVSIYDDTLSEDLSRLVKDFDRVAVPDYGKFVH